jgi:exonuclease SbcC
MRLHRLTVDAFGPFAGHEEIDFDELCDAGLFLLTGPTGAGKTSILDAVCFALYGTVPGVRGVKALKSQHAPVDTRPEVVLDFSIRDRRFLLRRSPEWTRPKLRGEGLITEKAAATLVETTTGEEHFLSSRAQEVGHLVTELVGMGSTQFVQVAMLPQGDFQKFLRASSQDRHDVLQHLFRTDRFARIEDWVHEHSRRLRERAATGESAVQRILDTVADRSGTELPEGLAGSSLAAAASEGRVQPWVEELVVAAEQELVRTQSAHEAAALALAEARARHDEADRQRAVAERRDQARSVVARLEASRDEAELGRAALEADRRAAACLPVLRMLEQAVRDRDACLLRRETALATLPDDTPADPGVAELDAAVEQLRTRIHRLSSLLPREQALVDARRAAATVERELEGARRERAGLAERRAQLPDRLATLQDRYDQTTRTASRKEALTLQAAAARERLEAARQVPRALHSLEEARDSARDTRDRAASARERLLDLNARRLAGIAAELAGRLEEGAPCLVCGSAEHPAPASGGEPAVTDAEQEQAAAELDERTLAHTAATTAVTGAEQRLAALQERSGGLHADAAATQLATLEEDVAAATEAESTVEAIERELATLTAEQERVTSELHAQETRIATLTQAVLGHRSTADAAAAELAEVLGPDRVEGSLAEVIEHHRRSLEALSRARETCATHDAAQQRVETVVAETEETAHAHGFPGPDAVREASLPGHERSRIEEVLQQRDDALARARAVLEAPDVLGIGDSAAADLEPLAAALDGATATVDAHARALHRQEQVAESLRSQQVRLDAALTEWAPVRDDYVRADAMARLVRGMSTDNQLQMRLSAYVLATRLDQVVEAANERLAHMRDQRYLLQRTGRAARKGSQAGLGLEMVDQWTGDVRDPSTLSGGETFVVSLALALGLADVVTTESGGTEIQTLFVDEGFGTLDADTLDDVMDRLDALRAGGRAVGVVSHVSELRNRIPTQLHVEKTRTGSTVAVRTAVG